MTERETYQLYLTTGFSRLERALKNSKDTKLHAIVADMKHSYKGLVNSYDEEIKKLEKAL